MQKSMFKSIEKHLTKLEKNIANISRLPKNGHIMNTFINDIYLDLKNMGEYLNSLDGESNEELILLNARYKNLLLEFDDLANQVPQDGGKVIASGDTLPKLIYRMTNKNQTIWVLFEKVASILGIGMIFFTITGITYFLTVGSIPFFKMDNSLTSGFIAITFLIGIIIGLIVHELAHAIVLANNKIKIVKMGLIAGSVVGGFVEADEETFLKAEPIVHLRFNASSIGTNALLTIFLVIIGVLTSADILIYLALGNFFFGFINSFPISPLDGGWVYEDLVTLYIKNSLLKKALLGARFGIFVIWSLLSIRLVLFL